MSIVELPSPGKFAEARMKIVHRLLLTLLFAAVFNFASHPASSVPFRELKKDYLPAPHNPFAWDKKRIAFHGTHGASVEAVKWFAKEAGLEFVPLSPPPGGIVCGIHPAAA